MLSPTSQTYSELRQAYEHFNAGLFQNQLPDCLITLQRKKSTFGYFSRERFGNMAGGRTDEIALNPTFFAVIPLQETMQTLVHEMTHLWQHHFGKPGRGRYHNDQWADKLESIGLMPSDTGLPGGKRTGDCMMDYPIAGGRFEQVAGDLFTQPFHLSWYDRFPSRDQIRVGHMNLSGSDAEGAPIQALVAPSHSEVVAHTLAIQPGSEQVAAVNRSNRLKYSCPCGNNAWGRPGLQIQCLACDAPFTSSQTGVSEGGLNSGNRVSSVPG